MANMIEFTTARLRLRQWCDADRAPFAKLNADRKVMEFFPATMDREASDTMVERWTAQIAERGWGLWATELKASGKFIGFIGLQIPATTLPFGPCVEIGWRLAAAHWGKGYATEGGRAVLGIGFGMLNLPEVVSFTAIGNLRSRAVMQRIGMHDSGETFEHPGVPAGNPLRLHCLYKISAAQWQEGLPVFQSPQAGLEIRAKPR